MKMGLAKNKIRYTKYDIRNTGFTIAELVVVVALVGLIMVFSIGILISNNRFYNNQTGEVRAINETREAADRINEFGRNADRFVESYTYNSQLYQTSSTTVIFRLPAIDQNEDILSGIFDHVIISKDSADDSRLILITDPGAGSRRGERTLQLTDALTSLNLTYDSSDLAAAVEAGYEVVVTHPAQNPATERVVGRVTLRN